MGSWVLRQGWSRENEFWIQFEEPLHPPLLGIAPGWRLFWLGGSAFLWANRCVSNQSVCSFLHQNSVLDLPRTCTLWLAEIPEPGFPHRCRAWLLRQRHCLGQGWGSSWWYLDCYCSGRRRRVHWGCWPPNQDLRRCPSQNKRNRCWR